MSELWEGRRAYLVVGAFALALRTLYVLVSGPNPLEGVDSVEYDLMARDLVAGKGLVDYVGYVRPPLYPLFLAGTYALGGWTVMQIAQVLLSSVTAVLIGVLGAQFWGRSRVFLAAGLMAAVYPWFFQWIGTIGSETLFSFLVVLGSCLALRASGSGSLRWTIVAGVVFGLAAFTRSNVLVAMPLVALWWWRTRGIVPAAVFAAALVLTLSPFSLSQYLQGNGVVLGSSGGGLPFYIGNNPDTVRFYGDDISDADWRRLSANSIMEDAAYRFVGCEFDEGLAACQERVPRAQRDAFWYSAGLRFASTNTAEWVGTEMRKLLHYWRPWVDPRAYPPALVLLSGLSFGALLVLAIAGLARMRRSSSAYVICFLIAGTVAAVAWTVQLRYRFALVDPLLIASAGLPMLAILERVRGRWRPRRD